VSDLRILANIPLTLPTPRKRKVFGRTNSGDWRRRVAARPKRKSFAQTHSANSGKKHGLFPVNNALTSLTANSAGTAHNNEPQFLESGDSVILDLG
jgi:nucleoid-associated protein YgaU